MTRRNSSGWKAAALILGGMSPLDFRLNPFAGRYVIPDVKSRLLPLLAAALFAPLVSSLVAAAATEVKLTRAGPGGQPEQQRSERDCQHV